MRIILVRHGHPEVASDTLRSIAGSDLVRWYRQYNEVGVARASRPPDTLCKAAADAGCIIASDLRRARESAILLAKSRHIHLDPDLREVGFPEGLKARTRLPPGVWVMIARVGWLIGLWQCDESKGAVRERARRLADRLTDLARAHGSVVAVGHGWFNLFVGRELRRRRWRGPHFVPNGYWESAQYSHDVGEVQ